MKQPHEVAKCEVVVSDHALNLVKLRQVGGIQGLVPEDAINGEVFDGRELLLLPHLVQHAGANGCRVRAQNILLCLLQLPVIPVTVAECVYAHTTKIRKENRYRWQ